MTLEWPGSRKALGARFEHENRQLQLSTEAQLSMREVPSPGVNQPSAGASGLTTTPRPIPAPR